MPTSIQHDAEAPPQLDAPTALAEASPAQRAGGRQMRRLKEKLQWNRDQLDVARRKARDDAARLDELQQLVDTMMSGALPEGAADAKGASAEIRRLRESVKTLRTRTQALQEKLSQTQNRSEELRQMVLTGRSTRRQLGIDLKAAQIKAAGSTFADMIAAGRPLSEAAMRHTEAVLGVGQRVEARAFAHALASVPGLEWIGKACSAVHAKRDGFDDYSWSLFNDVGFDRSLEVAPGAFVGSWLLHRPEEARAFIKKTLSRIDTFPAKTWWEIAQQAGGLKQFDILLSITDALLKKDPTLADLTAGEAQELRWADTRARALPAPDAPAPEVAPGVISLGIVDYKMLDRARTSSNVGDYVQTLAYLANLLRHQNIDFGESRLGQKLEALKARIKPDRRLDSHHAKVEPITIDRDFTSGKSHPNPTWTVAFGWHAHPNFSRYFDYPFAEGIKPIFISFHVNNVAMLSEATCDYLRRYEPIGCRDWTTVYALRERGVNCFFSGCMTTTIGQIFNRPPPEVRPEVALVDHRAEANDFPGLTPVKYNQVFDGVREMDMVSGLDAAEELLQGYRAYSAIATSRLHCYLPCTSIGLDVKFHPKRRSDVRFEGLLDLDPVAFQAIRGGIETKVEAILNTILSGASEEQVYARWRELCAPDVAFADQYIANVGALPSPSFDVDKVVSGIRKAQIPFNVQDAEDRLEVAFALDQNLQDHLPVVIESIVANTKRSWRANILSRGLEKAYFEQLAADFPQIEFRIFPCDDVDYGDRLRMLQHTTVSTMDRLLLPELLTDVGKLIYLDIDILVLGDLGELWDRDLEGCAIGGKSSTFPAWKYGHNMVYRAADALDADRAWDLRRRMHFEGPLYFQAFNAGVLLMDLDKMRTDQATERTVPLIEQYGMNDQDALNVYVRNQRIELGRVWNAVPSQDPTDDAKILHFAGPVKPWDELHILRKEDFARYRVLHEKRRAARLKKKPVARKRAPAKKAKKA